MSELKSCPFCNAAPIFPEAKDVFGTCYEAGCEECGIASVSIQIIDCFEHPRDYIHASYDTRTTQYAIQYIEVARQEAIEDWNRRAPAAEIERDAERYRHVRAHHFQTAPDSWIRSGDDLDEAVDAAMAKPEEV